MNINQRFAWPMLSIAIVCTAIVLIGAQARPFGDAPYTPTKREWLCLAFNAEECVDFLHGRNYSVIATPSARDANTVILRFGTADGFRAEALPEMLDLYKDKLHSLAKKYGFQGWLQIEEQITQF
jgi:hypothetical protein